MAEACASVTNISIPASKMITHMPKVGVFAVNIHVFVVNTREFVIIAVIIAANAIASVTNVCTTAANTAAFTTIASTIVLIAAASLKDKTTITGNEYKKASSRSH